MGPGCDRRSIQWGLSWRGLGGHAESSFKGPESRASGRTGRDRRRGVQESLPEEGQGISESGNEDGGSLEFDSGGVPPTGPVGFAKGQRWGRGRCQWAQTLKRFVEGWVSGEDSGEHPKSRRMVRHRRHLTSICSVRPPNGGWVRHSGCPICH